MDRYTEKIKCGNEVCGQPMEIQFTGATRKLRIICPLCAQLNHIEIIFPTDRGGPADLYGPPADREKIKIVVVPGD